MFSKILKTTLTVHFQSKIHRIQNYVDGIYVLVKLRIVNQKVVQLLAFLRIFFKLIIFKIPMKIGLFLKNF